MANQFSAVVRQHWADTIQENLEKSLIAYDIAEMVNIPDGVTKNLPWLEMRETFNYQRSVPPAMQDVTTFNDTITINEAPMTTFTINDFDIQDNFINLVPKIIRNWTYKIKERIEGTFLWKILEANWKYDANWFGRNVWTLAPITLVTGANQNISTTIGLAKSWLVWMWADGDNMDLVIDPDRAVSLQTLWLQLGTDLSTVMYRNSYRWNFSWMSTFEASCLTGTARLALSTIPVANDTVSIKWVIFKFVATATLPWDVAIWGTASTALTNLNNAINNTWTPWASTYIALSQKNRATLSLITSTISWTNLDIVSRNGVVLWRTQSTPATNKFGVQSLNLAVMERGSILLAMRPSNSVRVTSARLSNDIWENYFIYTRFGVATDTSGKERMCIVPVVAQPAEV